MRITRDEYYIEIVKLVARRSPCISRQVGAVVTDGSRILSTGYNGPPSTYPHCTTCHRFESGKDLDSCPALHAEANAIIYAANNQLKPTTIYTTTEPCFDCCRFIAAAGIKRIVFLEKYPVSGFCNAFLQRNGITKEHVNG